MILDPVSRMLKYKENNQISYAIRLPKDVARYHRGKTEGFPMVAKEWMGLMLLRLVLYPVDNNDRIFLDKYPLHMQFLPRIGDTCLDSFKLNFQDRRLKEKRASGYQQPII